MANEKAEKKVWVMAVNPGGVGEDGYHACGECFQVTESRAYAMGDTVKVVSEKEAEVANAAAEKKKR